MRNPLRALFEQRSIGSSHELFQSLGRGVRSLAGVDVSETTAMQIAAVASCVSLIARDVSSLPVDVIERVNERERRPAVTHPMRRVLSRPNSWQTWPEWVSMMMAHALLRGNAYNLMVRSGDVVSDVIPMHPDAVTVTQAPMPSLAITYTWTPANASRTYTFAQGDILHVRGVSTNGVTGRSVLADARETFGIALATQSHAARYWSGGGVPRVVLEHPKVVGKGAKHLEESWAKNYGAGSDQSQVAVLEEGMKISTLSVTAEDAQFLETRQFQRGEICGLFHVPPHMIGDTEKSTSWGSGIEQQQIGYYTHTLLPLIVNLEHRLNRSLLANQDRFGVKFYPQGLLRGDSAARATFYWQMRQLGALSANDVRMLEDMNPIADGDSYLQPANLVPLGYEPSPAKATVFA